MTRDEALKMLPSSFVNAADITAADAPATVVRKLDAAFHAATFKGVSAAVAGPSEDEIIALLGDPKFNYIDAVREALRRWGTAPTAQAAPAVVAEPAIDQQTQEALMRQAGIWIEYSTLFEDDLPGRPLEAVQAEKHQLDRYTQLVAEHAAAPQAPAAPAVDASDAMVWAVSRWEAEVKHRPLQNVHRRSLDDTWRQVIRHFGGDPEALAGPAHDDLLAAQAKEGGTA